MLENKNWLTNFRIMDYDYIREHHKDLIDRCTLIREKLP